MMKTKWVLIGVIAVVSVLHAYKIAQKSGIDEQTTPTGSGQTKWALSKSDGFKLETKEDPFLIEAKPNIYNVFVDTKKTGSNFPLRTIKFLDDKTSGISESQLFP